MVIDPLPRQDLPVVEPGRVADQVPLAEDRRLVPGRVQQLGKRGLRAVEPAVRVVVEAVLVRVLAGQDGRSAGPADRVRHDAPIEAHPFTGEAVDVGRFDQSARVVIGADGGKSVIVAEDEENVGRFRARGLALCTNFRVGQAGCNRYGQNPADPLRKGAFHDGDDLPVVGDPARILTPGRCASEAVAYWIAKTALPWTLELLAWVTWRLSAPALPKVTPFRNVCEP